MIRIRGRLGKRGPAPERRWRDGPVSGDRAPGECEGRRGERYVGQGSPGLGGEAAKGQGSSALEGEAAESG